MINVTVFSRNGRITGFEAAGHAESSPEGPDIICAACSVLMINTVNAIEVLTGNSVIADDEDGHLVCQFPNGLDQEGMLLIQTMLLGLTQIRDDYDGQYLQVTMTDQIVKEEE